MPIAFAETKISPEKISMKTMEMDHKNARDLRETDAHLYEAERYQNRLKISELRSAANYNNLSDNYMRIESERRAAEMKEAEDAKMRKLFMEQMLQKQK